MQTLLFHPFPQYLRFGGETLKSRVPLRPEDRRDGKLAEVWMASDHRVHSSIVRAGPAAGKTLRELLAAEGPALLGRHFQPGIERFPLMIRLLDVRENLPPAVHPGPGGSPDGAKYEAAYVLETDPGARLYSGVRAGLDTDEVVRMTLAGQSFSTMNAWPVAVGETYYVPPGQLHAWGAGNVLYEVHTTSNAIFALDWMDWDKDEARRQSDRDQLRKAIRPELHESGRVPTEPVSAPAGMRRERCCGNEHFVLDRVSTGVPVALDQTEGRFRLYTLIEGRGRVSWAKGGEAAISALDTFLVPAQADADVFVPSGPCTLLEAYLP
ncbi:MAG: hypothetical protein KA248_01295 [Kiritimatiellae bacterium]|nr:hypothetical protein [Kiritimatiellia bacterium]